jgi:RHS repeat-associated protein
MTVSRNADAFGYNARGEVVSATIAGGSPSPATAAYAYDGIGNLLSHTSPSITNQYTANSLNQYTTISGGPTSVSVAYDLDGNLLTNGVFSYAYDAASRLKTVSSNDVLLVTNFYDAKSRRVKKASAEATTTFFYDDWNLIEERVAYTNGATSTIHYHWGKNLSGTMQSAGGVGGLLYEERDGDIYVPLYDNNGNITRYCYVQGNVVASYTYDAFGNTIAQSGSMADFFRHRFSTKYFDSETGLYYYGYRYYKPPLMRWLNCDPIEEEGGINLYAFCRNNAIVNYDKDGCAYFAYRPLKAFRWFGIIGTDEDDWNNTVIAHENLFFEDGKAPDNLGHFSDGLHPDRDKRGYDTPHASGFNDCIMRKAVTRIRPLPYSLLGGEGRIKYNCQDWAAEVRMMYYALQDGRTYYPKSTTTIGEKRWD